MKKIILITVALFVSINVFAATEDEQTSIFAKDQKFDAEGVELYGTNLEMKSHKRLGAGFSLGGLSGMIGLNIEMNLVPQDAALVGIGRGESYNTFNVGWKHNYESEYLSLYTKVGYSKWFNASGGGSAGNSDILKRVLSDDEIRENRFSADFIAGGAGLEYNQLEGDLAGINFYGELLGMVEVRKSTFLPTGAVGITYFY